MDEKKEIKLSGAANGAGYFYLEYTMPSGTHVTQTFRLEGDQVYKLVEQSSKDNARTRKIDIVTDKPYKSSRLLPSLANLPLHYHAARECALNLIFGTKDLAGYELADFLEERAWLEYGLAQQAVKKAEELKRERDSNLSKIIGILTPLAQKAQSQPK